MKLRVALIVLFGMLCSTAMADDSAGPYKLLKSVTVGGDGGWDYLAVDSDARRLYVSRGSRFDVYDADSLEKVGEIPDTPNCHGVAWDKESGHGFTSDGNRDNPSVTMFDIKTLKVIKTISVTGRPDGIFFEPFTKHIFVESHEDPNETVINPADGTVVGTIDLGGEPEQGASDGKGHVYVNLESTSEVVVVDPAAMKVTARYKLGEGEGPSGMGLDAKNHRIFSCCGNAKMVVLDADSGKILATLPTGRGTDAGTFDPDTMEAFSSNGDGTLSVIKENSPSDFEVEQNVQTKRGARTCALDEKTRNIILVTAEPQAPSTAPAATQPAEGGRRRRRPRWAPGTFMILVVGKS
ncbi:MAG TPA: YncE family protein [Tepidisphaeraceae bacterium]|jgi:DNA-binding beta-propeller fold protein YncE|nr:YncE family protein [Tepidisphaeraceae bacterium]